ncbi:MAG: YdcH family protein [Nitrospirae bacterium]|nr:YdcH family protein [Nitrospirota bacterium]
MAVSSDETVTAGELIEGRLQALKKEHHALEIRLEELNGRRHLTTEEEVERNMIRKKKLFLKDQMSSIARGPMPSPPSPSGVGHVSPPPA